MKLADSEYIQSVVVDIQGGRIVSINRLLDDWGTELSRDNPGELSLRCEAGHFVSGLSSLTELADFITVQANGSGHLHITSKVHTSSTSPTGRPDREFTISQKEMVLSLVKTPSGERRMRPNLMK